MFSTWQESLLLVIVTTLRSEPFQESCLREQHLGERRSKWCSQRTALGSSWAVRWDLFHSCDISCHVSPASWEKNPSSAVICFWTRHHFPFVSEATQNQLLASRMDTKRYLRKLNSLKFLLNSFQCSNCPFYGQLILFYAAAQHAMCADAWGWLF